MSEATGLTLKGRIFQIQRFSLHDGPGIRTTVFLKGCPLRCVWCHNPEGISSGPLLSFQPERCIGCGYCFRVCPKSAHLMDADCHALNRDVCEACGLCAKECWAGALEFVGEEKSAEEILREVLRDKPFYDTSGGGMTLSGGEPLSQISFAEALLIGAKAERLHCCVETSGYANFSNFERIAKYVDLFLYDLKETNDAKHVEFTGVSNIFILNNLKALHDLGADIQLRLPIIPGSNDRDDHFRAVASLVKDLPRLTGVEILPYHPLGRSKYERFGLPVCESLQSSSVDKAEVLRWVERFAELGVSVSVSRSAIA